MNKAEVTGMEELGIKQLTASLMCGQDKEGHEMKCHWTVV